MITQCISLFEYSRLQAPCLLASWKLNWVLSRPRKCTNYSVKHLAPLLHIRSFYNSHLCLLSISPRILNVAQLMIDYWLLWFTAIYHTVNQCFSTDEARLQESLEQMTFLKNPLTDSVWQKWSLYIS